MKPTKNVLFTMFACACLCAPLCVSGQEVVSLRVSTQAFSFESKVVTGAPYTAQSVTESTQTLPDGNHIKRTNTVSIWRDSDGRTRREESLPAVGPWATGGKETKMVFIHDPVAGVSYALDPQAHTVTKTPGKRSGAASDEAERTTDAMRRARLSATLKSHAGESPVTIAPGANEQAVATFKTVLDAAPADRKEESLGSQTFEGVVADGKRVTETIPAGQVGNEKPIEVVSETWYSPELQAIVMSRHSDPRTGDSTYKLTNIQRTEPARSLFEPPADYAVKEGTGTLRFVHDAPMREQ